MEFYMSLFFNGENNALGESAGGQQFCIFGDTCSE